MNPDSADIYAGSPELSFRDWLMFILGYPGWQITSIMVTSIGIYFYLPPDGAGLTTLVSEEIFLGVLTAYGLARLVGGVVDSLADPLVGHYSDRSRSKLGRRRIFLIAGIVPMVGCPALLFFPPGEPGSNEIFVFLTVVLALYYIFFTVYVAPWHALIPEIAKTEAARVQLSRLRAMVGGPMIMAYGILWLAGVDAFKDAGVDATTAVQWVVVISCVMSFVFCMAPILAIDDSKFPVVHSNLNMRQALGATMSNRPFMIYLGAQIVFVLGVSMSGPAVPYIVRVLLGRDEGFAATLSLAMLPGILFGFMFIHLVVNRIGPRNTVITSILILGLSLFPYGLLEPRGPGDPGDLFNLSVVVATTVMKGLSIAGFMILPTVLLGQLIDLDETKTGANRAAMYYGVQGLFTKWVYAASAAILSYLLSGYGRSAEEPLGVQLIGPVAGLFCLIGAALYFFYPEKLVREQTGQPFQKMSAR